MNMKLTALGIALAIPLMVMAVSLASVPDTEVGSNVGVIGGYGTEGVCFVKPWSGNDDISKSDRENLESQGNYAGIKVGMSTYSEKIQACNLCKLELLESFRYSKWHPYWDDYRPEEDPIGCTAE